MKIEVLDKGHIELIDHMGSDLTVANAARVSFANESTFDTSVDSQILSLKEKTRNLSSILLNIDTHQHLSTTLLHLGLWYLCLSAASIIATGHGPIMKLVVVTLM